MGSKLKRETSQARQLCRTPSSRFEQGSLQFSESAFHLIRNLKNGTDLCSSATIGVGKIRCTPT
ncbi:unnamed protein product, partial [Nesidiocoris tenuis]